MASSTAWAKSWSRRGAFSSSPQPLLWELFFRELENEPIGEKYPGKISGTTNELNPVCSAGLPVAPTLPDGEMSSPRKEREDCLYGRASAKFTAQGPAAGVMVQKGFR
jgi:hypothetical protein